MSIDNVTDNRVVTGSDGGRGAANLNYILYIIGFFTGITAIIGVVLAYSNRDTASPTFRSHFDWQIKIFWRSVKFFIAMSVLYFLFTVIAVATFGLGIILYLIPFGIWIWWLVSTITRIAKGMRALGLGQPVALSGGDAGSVALPVAAADAPAAPVVSMPPEGWYADAERPGHTRWWNGAGWGMRDDEHPSTARATPSTDAEVVVVGSGAAPVELEPEPVVDPEVAVSQPKAVQAPAVAVAAVETSMEAVPATTTPSASETTPAPAQARFCENCGAARSPTGRFCTACGHA